MVKKLLGNIKGDKGEKGDNAISTVFNVEDYGATGNGVTDDSNAFQLCADALNQNGGGTFVIPYSNYVVLEDIQMYSNTVLDGNNSTIHVSKTSEGTPFNWENSVNITVRNLNINGHKELKNSELSGSYYGLRFRGECFNVTVYDCYIYNTLEHGISFAGYVVNNPDKVMRAKNIKIYGCTFEENGNPDFGIGARGTAIMCYYGTSNIHIYNNEFINIAQNFVYLDSGYGTREELESALPSLSVLNGDFMGYNNKVIGNTFTTTKDYVDNNPNTGGSGVVVHAQNNTVISQNIFNFKHSDHVPVYISGGQEHSPTKEIHISDNTMNVKKHGVRVFQSQYVYIKNNFIKQTENGVGQVILLEYASSPLSWDSEEITKVSDIEIKNNTIIFSKGSGINIANNGTKNDVYDVVIKNNVITLLSKSTQNERCINLQVSSDIEISGNSLKGGHFGVWLAGSGSDGMVVSDNYFKNNNVGILNQSKANIKNNSCENSTNTGIHNYNIDSTLMFNTGVVIHGNPKSLIHIENDGALSFSTTSNQTYAVSPIKIGSYYMWVNGLGNLMVKYGKPENQTDGTVIGTV